jgi:hypothetical protein
MGLSYFLPTINFYLEATFAAATFWADTRTKEVTGEVVPILL